jgi:hypothetical protein
MSARRVLLVAVLLAAASAAEATVVVLRNGKSIEGRVVREEFTHLTLEVKFPAVLGGGTGTRRIAWSEIRSLDGLSIADWKRKVASEVPVEVGGRTVKPSPPAVRFALDPRDWLRRYAAWIGSGEGFGVSFRLGALALLVLLPALLVLLGGRWMGIEHLDGLRAFGGAVIGLGAGAALYRTWPGWVGAWPLGAMAGIGVAVLLVTRPPPAKGLVLVALQWVGLAGAIVAALAGSGSFS